MDDVYREYILGKCENAIKTCGEYQELNKTVIDIERKLKLILSGETLDLFNKYAECSCRQSVIYTENLIETIQI